MTEDDVAAPARQAVDLLGPGIDIENVGGDEPHERIAPIIQSASRKR
jgi:hypothetical protein